MFAVGNCTKLLLTRLVWKSRKLGFAYVRTWKALSPKIVFESYIYRVDDIDNKLELIFVISISPIKNLVAEKGAIYEVKGLAADLGTRLWKYTTVTEKK